MSESENSERTTDVTVAETAARLRQIEAELASGDAMLEHAGGEWALLRVLDRLSPDERQRAYAAAVERMGEETAAIAMAAGAVPNKPRRPRTVI